MRIQKIITFIALFLLHLICANAEIRTVSDSELRPEKKHLRTSELISHILSTYHYKKTELNDQISSLILDNYLENLDQNKVYFLKEDIKEFEKYRYQIDDNIKQSNLDLAFTIFKRYRQRVIERIAFALKKLDNKFDFDIDEDYRFDRREADWVDNKTNLDEIWRKRVKNDALNLVLTKKTLQEIKQILTDRYTRIRTNTFQLNSSDVFQTFINAYTRSIEPHTAYFSPRTSENFDISMRLSLEGIGAVLRGDNDYTQIVKIITGGPADLSNKLEANDRIIGVGQGVNGKIIDVIGWRLDNVVELIRGPKGTTIRLEILPKDAGLEGPSKIITLTRNKIKLEEQDASSQIITIPETKTKIGVIDLPTFYIDFTAQAKGIQDYKSTSRDVRRLIKEMLKDNIDGLIIDLRDNGGGSLNEALELTGLFIDRGPIVQTKNTTGKININYDPEPGLIYPGPLAVLVNRNSASASEIFAGAIQDYRRGIIIGEITFGKGTVQNVIDLNRFIKKDNKDYGRLKTTIAQFFRISGSSNQFKGVVPDIIFPTADDPDQYGERIYDNALPWEQEKPVHYYPANAPVTNFKLVKQEHKKRIKNDKLFQLLITDLDLKRQISKKRAVSLLKSKRQKEREELMNAKKEIINAMRIEKNLPPLKEVDANKELEEDESIDILLNETANILNNLIVPDTYHLDIHTANAKKQAILNDRL